MHWRAADEIYLLDRIWMHLRNTYLSREFLRMFMLQESSVKQ